MEANYLTILLPLLGGGIGYFIKHMVEKRKELISEVNKERREHYQKFINLVVDILKGVKLKGHRQDKMLTDLFEFYKKYILYASPEVIIRFSDYFQYLYNHENSESTDDTKNHFKKLTAIMVAMRVDLGLSNKKLGNNGEYLIRALLTDFDKYFTIE